MHVLYEIVDINQLKCAELHLNQLLKKTNSDKYNRCCLNVRSSMLKSLLLPLYLFKKVLTHHSYMVQQ